MNTIGLSAQLKYARRDLGNQLFHFTRRTPVELVTPGFPSPPPPKTAFEVLIQILAEGKLRGGTGFVKGSYKCVCFTESPISEIGALFALSAANPINNLPRYEPYGIAVKKEWLYEKKGRPVIYQHSQEFALLPPAIQWRHVRYEPPYVDLTWEREWRVCAEELTITPNDVLVVVPTAKEAHSINFQFSQLTQSVDMTGRNIVYSSPTWTAVSLDLFGLSQ